jgi:hypothetical protein
VVLPLVELAMPSTLSPLPANKVDLSTTIPGLGLNPVSSNGESVLERGRKQFKAVFIIKDVIERVGLRQRQNGMDMRRCLVGRSLRQCW